MSGVSTEPDPPLHAVRAVAVTASERPRAPRRVRRARERAGRALRGAPMGWGMSNLSGRARRRVWRRHANPLPGDHEYWPGNSTDRFRNGTRFVGDCVDRNCLGYIATGPGYALS